MSAVGSGFLFLCCGSSSHFIVRLGLDQSPSLTGNGNFEEIIVLRYI
jgi:hypothetical protein